MDTFVSNLKELSAAFSLPRFHLNARNLRTSQGKLLIEQTVEAHEQLVNFVFEDWVPTTRKAAYEIRICNLVESDAADATADATADGSAIAPPIRKRGRPPKSASAPADASDIEPAPKKKRGRPPKSASAPADASAIEPAPKKKRGRPPKSVLASEAPTDAIGLEDPPPPPADPTDASGLQDATNPTWSNSQPLVPLEEDLQFKDTTVASGAVSPGGHGSFGMEIHDLLGDPLDIPRFDDFPLSELDVMLTAGENDNSSQTNNSPHKHDSTGLLEQCCVTMKAVQNLVGSASPEKTAVEQPVVAPPVVEQPEVEPPVVEQPAVEQSAVEQPVVEQPVVEQPVVEQPVVEPPVVAPPVVEQPVVEQPAVENNLPPKKRRLFPLPKVGDDTDSDDSAQTENKKRGVKKVKHAPRHTSANATSSSEEGRAREAFQEVEVLKQRMQNGQQRSEAFGIKTTLEMAKNELQRLLLVPFSGVIPKKKR